MTHTLAALPGKWGIRAPPLDILTPICHCLSGCKSTKWLACSTLPRPVLDLIWVLEHGPDAIHHEIFQTSRGLDSLQRCHVIKLVDVLNFGSVGSAKHSCMNVQMVYHNNGISLWDRLLLHNNCIAMRGYIVLWKCFILQRAIFNVGNPGPGIARLGRGYTKWIIIYLINTISLFNVQL